MIHHLCTGLQGHLRNLVWFPLHLVLCAKCGGLSLELSWRPFSHQSGSGAEFAPVSPDLACCPSHTCHQLSLPFRTLLGRCLHPIPLFILSCGGAPSAALCLFRTLHRDSISASPLNAQQVLGEGMQNWSLGDWN